MVNEQADNLDKEVDVLFSEVKGKLETKLTEGKIKKHSFIVASAQSSGSKKPPYGISVIAQGRINIYSNKNLSNDAKIIFRLINKVCVYLKEKDYPSAMHLKAIPEEAYESEDKAEISL